MEIYDWKFEEATALDWSIVIEMHHWWLDEAL